MLLGTHEMARGTMNGTCRNRQCCNFSRRLCVEHAPRPGSDQDRQNGRQCDAPVTRGSTVQPRSLLRWIASVVGRAGARGAEEQALAVGKNEVAAVGPIGTVFCPVSFDGQLRAGLE